MSKYAGADERRFMWLSCGGAATAAPKWGRGPDLAGPERPTFTERAIAALPMPYLLACVILAVLLESPGFLLASFVDSGDFDQALQVTYGDGLVSPAWSLGFLVAFGVGFYTFLFYLVRASRLRLASAGKDIAPLLPDGEEGFRRIFGRIHEPLPVLLAAAGFAAFFTYLSLQGGPPPLGPAQALVVAARFGFGGLVDATVLWIFFTTLWGLHRLGKEPLRLRPYYEDPMLGLRPLGTMSVSATLVYFGAVALVIVPVLFTPQHPGYLAFLLGLVLFGAVLFVLPLLRIHRRMLEEKQKAERALGEEAAPRPRAFDPPAAGSEPTLVDLRGMLVNLHRTLALEREERKVASLPTWPFDPKVSGQIAAITLTGIVAILGRAAVDYFLLSR